MPCKFDPLASSNKASNFFFYCGVWNLKLHTSFFKDNLSLCTLNLLIFQLSSQLLHPFLQSLFCSFHLIDKCSCVLQILLLDGQNLLHNFELNLANSSSLCCMTSRGCGIPTSQVHTYQLLLRWINCPCALSYIIYCHKFVDISYQETSFSRFLTQTVTTLWRSLTLFGQALRIVMSMDAVV